MDTPLQQLHQALKETQEHNEQLKMYSQQFNQQISQLQHHHDRLHENILVNARAAESLQHQLDAVSSQQSNITSQCQVLHDKWKLKNEELDSKIAMHLQEQNKLQNNLQTIQKAALELQVPVYDQPK